MSFNRDGRLTVSGGMPETTGQRPVPPIPLHFENAPHPFNFRCAAMNRSTRRRLHRAPDDRHRRDDFRPDAPAQIRRVVHVLDHQPVNARVAQQRASRTASFSTSASDDSAAGVPGNAPRWIMPMTGLGEVKSFFSFVVMGKILTREKLKAKRAPVATRMKWQAELRLR